MTTSSPGWRTATADRVKFETPISDIEYTDCEIGGMPQAFDEVGEADSTLVFRIAGDNGTSGKGGQLGEPSEPFANRQRIRAGVGLRRNFAWRCEVLCIWTRSRNTTDEVFTTSDNSLNVRVNHLFR